MSAYDEIAQPYKELLQLPLFQIVGYSLFRRLGDLAGKSVLDLACGEGIQTRRLKQAGAAHVVGVDISTEMLGLARAQEAAQPLGIEYIHSPAQTLGTIGSFDLVVAAFFLHYAATYDDLVDMCRVAYDNLKPGQRFVTVNENCARGLDYPEDALAKYGVRMAPAVPGPLAEGDRMVLTLSAGAHVISFENYYRSRETYERALADAGFKSSSWHRCELPPDREQQDGLAFWEPFLEMAPLILIEARKG